MWKKITLICNWLVFFFPVDVSVKYKNYTAQLIRLCIYITHKNCFTVMFARASANGSTDVLCLYVCGSVSNGPTDVTFRDKFGKNKK
jgi:hypothetical protein